MLCWRRKGKDGGATYVFIPTRNSSVHRILQHIEARNELVSFPLCHSITRALRYAPTNRGTIIASPRRGRDVALIGPYHAL